jgi:hypothetical protein
VGGVVRAVIGSDVHPTCGQPCGKHYAQQGYNYNAHSADSGDSLFSHFSLPLSFLSVFIIAFRDLFVNTFFQIICDFFTLAL